MGSPILRVTVLSDWRRASARISAALRRHVDVSAMTFMKGGDFKKAAAAKP